MEDNDFTAGLELILLALWVGLILLPLAALKKLFGSSD